MTEEELQTKLKGFEDAHGDILVVKVPRTETRLVFKMPPLEDYEMFQLEIQNDEPTPGSVFRQLCLTCVVMPTAEELASVFQKMPALPIKIASALGKMAGGNVEIEVGK